MQLEACVVSGSRRDGARRESLVFGVGDVRNRPVPTGAAVTAAVALIQGRAGLALRTDCAGPRPEFHRLLVYHVRAHSNN